MDNRCHFSGKGALFMDAFFEENTRLGIPLPRLERSWESYSPQERESILFEWEKIRGHIPDRIKDLENIINEKQAKLEVEENFVLTCRLNSEIAEHASVINDLWLWYRTDQTISGKPHL
jgi:hypothetical protein